jgi:hypothetical protein
MNDKALILAVFCASVTACTTVGKMQASCEKTSATFPELTVCLKQSIEANGSNRMQSDASVKLYLLKADQLSQRVQNKEISDLDARVELQTLYVNLKANENAEQAAGAAAYNANRPRRTNCYPVGNTVQCNSY